MAIAATILTGLAVMAIATEGVPCAGPGLLIWYAIFKYSRRRAVTLDLRNCKRIILDDAKQRILLLIQIDSLEKWIGIHVPDYRRVVDALEDMVSDRDELRLEHAPTRRTDWAVWILFAIIAMLIASTIVMVAIEQLL